MKIFSYIKARLVFSHKSEMTSDSYLPKVSVQHGANAYFNNDRKSVERMYEAENAILNKWRNEPNFKKVISKRRLIWFYRLSSVRSFYRFTTCFHL